jgi:hypothetical protein
MVMRSKSKSTWNTERIDRLSKVILYDMKRYVCYVFVITEHCVMASQYIQIN